MNISSDIRRIGLENDKEVFNYLKSIKSINDSDNINYLIDLLKSTNEKWIINGCSLALSEAVSQLENVKHSLISKLKNLDPKSDIGTLVFACSYFDYSEDLKFFIKLILIANDETVMESKAVLKSMKRVKKKDLIEAYSMILRMKQKGEFSSSKIDNFKKLEEYLIQRIGNRKITDELKSLFI